MKIKNLILFAFVFSLLFAFLLTSSAMAEFVKKSKAEFEQLSNKERQEYITALIEEIARLKKAKLDMDAEKAKELAALEKLKAEISAVDAEFKAKLAIFTPLELAAVEKSVVKLEKMSESELREKNRKESGSISNELNSLEDRLDYLRRSGATQLPEVGGKYSDKINELSSRIAKLRELLSKKTAQGDCEDEYIVKPNDWLAKIAGYKEIYNDYRQWPRIFRANQDKCRDPQGNVNPNWIYPGQVLRIPRCLPTEYTVVAGDWLAKIAGYVEIYNDYRQWPRIYEANKDQIKDPNLIYPGQVFKIPR